MRQLFLFCLMIISFNIFAGPGTGEFYIQEIRAESGSIYIYPKTELNNDLECEKNSPVKLEPDDLGFEQMFSLAITAQTTKQKIKFWLRSCVSSPWGKTVPKAYAAGLVTD